MFLYEEKILYFDVKLEVGFLISFLFRIFCTVMAACVAVIGKENSPLYVHCANAEQVGRRMSASL